MSLETETWIKNKKQLRKYAALTKLLKWKRNTKNFINFFLKIAQICQHNQLEEAVLMLTGTDRAIC